VLSVLKKTKTFHIFWQRKVVKAQRENHVAMQWRFKNSKVGGGTLGPKKK